jgi:hypothetical protein
VARRRRAFAGLDSLLLRTEAPLVPLAVPRVAEFFSKRVDPKSVVFDPVSVRVDLAALRLRG